MLANIQQKIKEIRDLPKDVFMLVMMVLVVVGSFMIWGLLSGSHRRGGDIRITQTLASNLPSGALAAHESSQGKSGTYVGSINGKTYHLPTCSGARRIRSENQVWFTSKGEAEGRGYRPAVNCKGI